MMRGVIQVRCQRPCAASGAGGDHGLEIAVEGDAVAVLAHQPRQIVRDVEILEEQHRALRRRPPFQRRDMRERIEPAPVGGEQRRQRQIVHDAGKTRRVGERVLGIGQGVVGREHLLEAEPREVRQARQCAPASAPRPRPASSARPCRRGSRGTARRGGRPQAARKAPYGRRGRPNLVPKRVEMAKFFAFISHARANGGLSE